MRGRHRRRGVIGGIVGLAGLALLASCTSSADDGSPSAVLTRSPAARELIDDGSPGWAGAVNRRPDGYGRAATWNGSELVAIGYGASASSGILRVATYDPARGDWFGLTDPFGERRTTSPVLGSDGQGRTYVVAGSCAAAAATDEGAAQGNLTATTGGDGSTAAAPAAGCAVTGWAVAVLVGDGWSDVAVAADLAAPTAAPDAVRFIGPGRDAAGFSFSGRPTTISPDGVVPVAGSGLAEPVGYCSEGDDLFAFSAAPADGSGSADLRWRRRAASWAPIDVPGADTGENVGPFCTGVGLALIDRSGDSTVLRNLTLDPEPSWTACPLSRVAADDRFAVVTSPESRRFVTHGGAGADATTRVVECTGSRASTLTTYDGPAPTQVFAVGALLVLISPIGGDLQVRVLGT